MVGSKMKIYPTLPARNMGCSKTEVQHKLSWGFVPLLLNNYSCLLLCLQKVEIQVQIQIQLKMRLQAEMQST